MKIQAIVKYRVVTEFEVDENMPQEEILELAEIEAGKIFTDTVIIDDVEYIEL